MYVYHTTSMNHTNSPDVWDLDPDIANGSINCTNDYCLSDEDYWILIYEHIFPTPYEWVLITFHFMVFMIGLVGNVLVGVAVYRNHSMQTVTNYFIVNLAVADLLVILVCLPPSVVWDVTETWFLGSVPCKIVVFIQTTSVSVSVLTLTFISVDRWYAICYPLKFTSTTARAKTAIFILWVLSIIIAIPELVVFDTVPKDFTSPYIQTILFTDCRPSWDDEKQKTYQFALMILLYILPFFLMSIAYYQIIRVLWRDNIPGSAETNSSVIDSAGRKSLMRGPNSSTQGQIRSRRKAAKMLIAVVIMFGICYFPVHLLNVLRYTRGVDNNDATIAISLLSHWLCYANSAMNPLIYNFMSGKFRKEFRHLYTCRCFRPRLRKRIRTLNSGDTYRFVSSATHVETIHMNSFKP